MNDNELYAILDKMLENGESPTVIEGIRRAIEEGDYELAIEKINGLKNTKAPTNNNNNDKTEKKEDDDEEKNKGKDNIFDIFGDDDDNKNTDNNEEDEDIDDNAILSFVDEEEEPDEVIYPSDLVNYDLEETYIGMLVCDPKAIAMYYIVYDKCFFADRKLLNIYKSILFTEGQAYAPEVAKRGFNFAKESKEMNDQKLELKEKYYNKNYNFEKIYVELQKLFVLRRNYLSMPIKDLQERIMEIVHYYLYDQMSIEEVEAAVEQVTVTQKFKSSVLSTGTSSFLMRGENDLTTGLPIPFKILSGVFKGIRKGETMSFSMPSNAGKSRFTINLAAYIAFIHRKKVLVISNEMSEEKMKLCLITTVLNNPEIQKLHGQQITKSEGELLEFKFRPDDPNSVKTDKNGYVLREEGEPQIQFAKRLEGLSEEYRKTIAVTKWLDKQINNSIYFINITDHTNDELKKVVVNYYYKEKIEYMFYDTMKTDTENIGNGEELKKTATILSNLAQDFKIYIGSTLQLTETSTLPINLSINDLAVSRTVKEVLDTLCLIKQIQRDDLDDYEYSFKEVGNECFDLEKYEDPDVRYYACVIDKNRAGAKPKVLFRLNLAYNRWEEVGYLRLKSKVEN